MPAEALILDVNILIRAVFRVRVRQILEKYDPFPIACGLTVLERKETRYADCLSAAISKSLEGKPK